MLTTDISVPDMEIDQYENKDKKQRKKKEKFRDIRGPLVPSKHWTNDEKSPWTLSRIVYHLRVFYNNRITYYQNFMTFSLHYFEYLYTVCITPQTSASFYFRSLLIVSVSFETTFASMGLLVTSHLTQIICILSSEVLQVPLYPNSLFLFFIF